MAISKITGTQECAKYKTLGIISHTSKVLLELFNNDLLTTYNQKMLKNSSALSKEKELRCVRILPRYHEKLLSRYQQQKLQDLSDILVHIAFGMEVSTEKSKVMITSKDDIDRGRERERQTNEYVKEEANRLVGP
ncbi:hypothetical protein CAPTEDRAFT_194647 [Capitella teleta]|uniref:Uncharacterized protein n=1 Tax=Capitella teleta TaxID=283909 RepID=R7UTX1_CAPTE|nr:hypothetical protein CAPTEDRAFT_194647 [Capitella teleta]|eukprot:ELU09974.1 hypothetical protein CAPTEDRAFT_194647 [Capitella teleta]